MKFQKKPIFFISCPLGYERELGLEITEFWFEMMDTNGLPTCIPCPEFEYFKGGIEIETELHLGLQINFFSKLASRVLLRINKFKSRYYDQFEKGIKDFELGNVLNDKNLQIRVESHKSRLNNSKNLIESATTALKGKFQITEDSLNSLYVRIENDVVTVSVDTSGDHLHKRGYSSFRGAAPLRENLAAYLVRRMGEFTDFNENILVVDPFAGSGTLLFEFASCKLPNFNRKFSFLNHKYCPKIFLSPTWVRNYRWLDFSVSSVEMMACDVDDKSIKNIKSNLAEFSKSYSGLNIDIRNKNSAELKLPCGNKKNWILTNPPYGERLENRDALKIINSFSGVEGIVVIHPLDWKIKPDSMKTLLCEDFNNQGLKLKLSILKSVV